ncbi:MAG: hypothetical protein H6Q90_306 [Deltaproteobacteria bacterium]|nr:hypothetical protein [Deltaproteobacteria bacterium]
MAADSSTQLATAVEVASDRPQSELARGFALGTAATAAFAHVLLLWNTDGVLNAYRELTAELPVTTRITLSKAWMWGVPSACALAIGLLVTTRPRAGVAYIVVAVGFVAALLATWHFPFAPLQDLADNLRP